MIRQRTLAISSCYLSGLHSGRKVSLTFRPAPVNTGIVYVRTDLQPEVVTGLMHNLSIPVLCTALVNEMAGISTVEHLSAALAC